MLAAEEQSKLSEVLEILLRHAPRLRWTAGEGNELSTELRYYLLKELGWHSTAHRPDSHAPAFQSNQGPASPPLALPVSTSTPADRRRRQGPHHHPWR